MPLGLSLPKFSVGQRTLCTSSDNTNGNDVPVLTPLARGLSAIHLPASTCVLGHSVPPQPKSGHIPTSAWVSVNRTSEGSAGGWTKGEGAVWM